MECVKYCVGEKIDLKTEGEGAKVEADDNMLICFIGLNNISKNEKEAVELGKIQAFLTAIDKEIFLCLNIGDILNFDMPFNMGLYSKYMLKYPKVGGYLMPIILYDYDSKVIVAIRMVGFNIDFSRKFYELSKNQWIHRIENHNETVQSVYNRFTTEQLMEKAVEKQVFEGMRR